MCLVTLARMFNPPHHRVDDRAEVFDLIDRAAFGHLVSYGMHGFNATGLPFLLDRTAGPFGSLRGHFARANGQWKRVDGSDVFVLFALADAYVTPAWYPSKAEHGRVVPTWNYEVVHAHGTARIHDDVEWVRQIVTDLTERHEEHRASENGQERWAVTDAPDDFIEKVLRAIVGVEIEISLVEGKQKLSQNRPAEDQAGVAEGLRATPGTSGQMLADAMAQLRKSSAEDNPHLSRLRGHLAGEKSSAED